jgi:hypothetical protein
MATTFHLFPNLPAELRVRIWRIALEDDYDELKGRHRIIELHGYNPELEKVAVAVSRRYPTLFEVDREARCEAAKAGGGEWITVSVYPVLRWITQRTDMPMVVQVNARFDGRRAQKDHTTSFEIYINFSQDIVFLSNRYLFLEAPRTLISREAEPKVEILLDVFPNSAVEKIAYLVVTTARTSCNSKHIEKFTALKRLHFYTSHRVLPNILARQRFIVQVLKAWESRDAEVPLISYHSDSNYKDHDTLMWLLDTGVMDVPRDGIRTVEWGFRKDLWVPRAKKGSGTLRKIDVS